MTRRIINRVGLMLLSLALALNGLFPALASDVEKGKKVYEEKRCRLCHAIGGEGGKLGPELADVGAKRDRDWLMRFLKDPKGTLTGAKMTPVKATPEEMDAMVDYLLSLKK